MTIRIGQSQVHASGRGLDNTVRNLPEVRRELVKGIGRLLGWCKGVREKKTMTRQKIIGDSRKAYREFGRFNHDRRRSYRLDMDLRSILGIRPRIGRCRGSLPGVRQEICRRDQEAR
ncbi:hypothetical protein B296_00051657 [Ensete ventricosum]|uniref:Uncharacterized protein n=1 Tax=Ensete ventricosum TaxID=4639 RepID=A0A426YFS5_ENSVE|nr:hypothetical protein B296_00051657 [Ensete ventricosum]